MKKYLFILTLLGTVCILHAQTGFKEFAPIGATWYYDRQEMVPYDARGYIRYTVERDTIIDSRNMKIVSINGAKSNTKESFWGYTYIYVENSKVYHLIDNELKLVFDYGLQPGDTLKVLVDNYDCDSISSIILDSVSIEVAGNDTIKVQKLSFYRRFIDFSDVENVSYEIFEGIGTKNGFLGTPICNYEALWGDGYLRCYHDDEIHYVATWWSNAYPGVDCDEIINKVSVPANEDKNFVTVYPNPVIDFLSIDYVDNITIQYNVILYNIYGEKLLTQHQSKMLDMQPLPGGVYLLYIIRNNDSTVFKIIKK